jgi:hypothetical protein
MPDGHGLMGRLDGAGSPLNQSNLHTFDQPLSRPQQDAQKPSPPSPPGWGVILDEPWTGSSALVMPLSRDLCACLGRLGLRFGVVGGGKRGDLMMNEELSGLWLGGPA